MQDGGNDLCLSKKLSEKDYVFPRKNYKLYKLLFNENKKNEIKANIYPWQNGQEIIDILETLQKFQIYYIYFRNR